jgi:hypothetical protein
MSALECEAHPADPGEEIDESQGTTARTPTVWSLLHFLAPDIQPDGAGPTCSARKSAITGRN